jgi:hypothetical protein
MTIASELLALRDDEGLIHAAGAVEWARVNRDSALYGALDWDDAHAAHQYRVEQVRRLIRVHIVNEDGHRTAISLVFDRPQGGGYRSTEDVMRNAQMRQSALDDALAELERFQQRYAYLTELAGVFEAAEQARTKRRRRPAPEGRASA